MKPFAIIAGVIAIALIGWFVFEARQRLQPLVLNGTEEEPYHLSVAETDPYKGNRSAPVIIIAVGSFTCPACKNQAKALDQLLANYPNEIKIVWKDLPENEEHSVMAAVAARCAHQQGRFWEYHDKLFLKQDILVDTSFLTSWAADVGLATATFERCLASRDVRALVNASVNEVLRTNISQIPFLQINQDLIMEGYQSFPRLKEAVLPLLQHAP